MRAPDKHVVLSTGQTCRQRSKTVSKCSVCNENAYDQQKEMMMSYELPMWPWQIISMNLFKYRGKDFILMVDH